MADANLRLEGRSFKICEHCGKDFYRPPHRQEAGRFCSRECSFAHKREQSQASRLEHSPHFGPYRHLHSCGYCAGEFPSLYEDAKYCSASCKGKAKRRRWIAKDANAERHNAYHRDNQRRLRGVVAKVVTCLECGSEVVKHHKAALFCCRACGERYHNRVDSARRRAPIGVRFDPIDILERDGWRCQMCGQNTPRHNRGTCRPNAPELDHIFPVSKGGSHTPENTQCLCRSCNGIKGARLMDEMRIGGACF